MFEPISQYLRKNDISSVIKQVLEENETSEIMPADLEQKVKDFVKANANMDDETMHKFAAEIGVDKHEVEEVAYKVLNQMLNACDETDEAKCAKKKKTEESFEMTDEEFVDILTGEYMVTEMSMANRVAFQASRGFTTMLLAGLIAAGAAALYFRILRKTREAKLLKLKIDKEENSIKKEKLMKELAAKQSELKALDQELQAKKAQGKEKYDKMTPDEKKVIDGKAEKMKSRLVNKNESVNYVNELMTLAGAKEGLDYEIVKKFPAMTGVHMGDALEVYKIITPLGFKYLSKEYLKNKVKKPIWSDDEKLIKLYLDKSDLYVIISLGALTRWCIVSYNGKYNIYDIADHQIELSSLEKDTKFYFNDMMSAIKNQALNKR